MKFGKLNITLAELIQIHVRSSYLHQNKSVPVWNSNTSKIRHKEPLPLKERSTYTVVSLLFKNRVEFILIETQIESKLLMKRDIMRERIRELTKPVTELVFPPVCACCGDLLIDHNDIICDYCLNTRFEMDTISADEILPESVLYRFSMWQFDKSGYLQNLLHKLKYDHITTIGVQLGREAGRHFLKHINGIHPKSWILIPVPLHKSRFRKRGFNQSREIARGVAESTKIQLVDENIIVRTRNTKTQTGLNSKERIENLSGAFQILKPESLKNYQCLLVDDVYTTGATTFELAQTLADATGKPCGIVTLARA